MGGGQRRTSSCVYINTTLLHFPLSKLEANHFLFSFAGQTSHITQLTRHNAQLTRQLQAQHNSELVREENRALHARVADLDAEVQRMARAEAELRASASAAVKPVESEASKREKEEREAELTRLRMQNAALLDEVGELRSAGGKAKGKANGTKNVLDRNADDEEGDEDAEAQIADLEAEAERLRGMVAALQVKVRVGSEERKVLRGILVRYFDSRFLCCACGRTWSPLFSTWFNTSGKLEG